MGPTGMLIGVKDLGCGQAMWGKSTPTSNSYQLHQLAIKLQQQSLLRESI
jgi:hypothetical protein